MSKKSDKKDLDAHLEWEKWGDQFGFDLFGTNGEFTATFILPSGATFVVWKEARELIDRRISK